jgi:hypothetical protein
MRSGIVASSAGESSSSVGIVGRLLSGFGIVMLTVMYSVTGCVDRAAFPPSFSRTQGISARDVQLIAQKGILNEMSHFERLGQLVCCGSIGPKCVRRD